MVEVVSANSGTGSEGGSEDLKDRGDSKERKDSKEGEDS